MIIQAENKIKAEMEKEKNPYVKTVGDFLIGYIKRNEAEAEKIVADEKKTIMGSIEAMRKEAGKNKVDNMAMLTPEQGFAVVLKYFGIKSKEDVKVEYSFDEAKAGGDFNTKFDAKLDDFL